MRISKAFFEEIQGLITSARATVARGVDLVQVYTNFEIGRRIVQQEQKGKGRAAYGEEVIGALAERLVQKFGRGFSARNLASMKAFYLLYQERGQILQSATAKLGNSQNATAPALFLQSMNANFDPAGKSQSMIGHSKNLQSLTAESDNPPIPPSLIGGSSFPEMGQSVTDQSTAPRPFCLSWTHYVFLLTIKNPDERSFYEIESASEPRRRRVRPPQAARRASRARQYQLDLPAKKELLQKLMEWGDQTGGAF